MDRIEFTDWYIWPYQLYSGDFNMFMDHWLARQMGKLLDKPLLRFYGWQPPCISLGYHQNASDVTHHVCMQEEIDVVRRPTGGRAILHAEELTYSVIYPYQDLDISDFYRLVHIPFVLALEKMQIKASFESSQADFSNIYRTDRAFLCFASSAKYEVEISGKKLIGSAQRVYENAILQHGSVLLGSQHEKLVDFLNLPESRKLKMKQYIKEHTTNVWTYRKDLDVRLLADEIQEKFSNHYGINFQELNRNQRLKVEVENLSDYREFSILNNSTEKIKSV
ncbi:MAG: lipoate--protein ligase family protein [Calditrichia bacterium]|nr:lipoate--protein ligase family protein [Calditrichia bacterium]